MVNCLLRLCEAALDQLEHELLSKGDFRSSGLRALSRGVYGRAQAVFIGFRVEVLPKGDFQQDA